MEHFLKNHYILTLRLCILHESQLSLLLWSDKISSPVYLSWWQTDYGRYPDFVFITSLNQWWDFFFFFAFPITHPRFKDSQRPKVCSKKNLQRKCSYSEPKSGKRKLLMVTVGRVLFFFLSFIFLSHFSHEWLLWWWWQQKPQWGSGSCLNWRGGKVLSLTTGITVPKTWAETPWLSLFILIVMP